MILNIIMAYVLASAFVGGIVLTYKFFKWLDKLLT